MSFKILFVRFEYENRACSELVTWLMDLQIRIHGEKNISEFTTHALTHEAPIHCARNLAVAMAKKAGIHYLGMVDHDMHPDLYIHDQGTTAEPFWKVAWSYMMATREEGPCVIGAPACSGPPFERVNVMRYTDLETNTPEEQWSLRHLDRAEAAEKKGILKVDAMGTGLTLWDMRVFDILKPPYFDFEYKNEEKTQVVTSEDIYCTRNLSHLNVPVYCAFNSWSGHYKEKLVTKPQPLTAAQIGKVLNRY